MRTYQLYVSRSLGRLQLLTGPHALLCRSEPSGPVFWSWLLGESTGHGVFLKEGNRSSPFSFCNGDGHT